MQDEKYPCLSAIARRRELHPEMPNSAQQLLMHLQEAEGVSASPFGQPLKQEAHFGAKPWYFLQMPSDARLLGAATVSWIAATAQE